MTKIPSCKYCNSNVSHTSYWTQSETIIWKCGTWQNKEKELFEQSGACKIKQLENQVKDLKQTIKDLEGQLTDPVTFL